ncbi:hypothetical protein [Elizabethkingia miricola]|uniref:hypothetical protein n=1 Tax=Elizabethkingia miricola TaxID=172045 RepID=UPI003891B4E2
MDKLNTLFNKLSEYKENNFTKFNVYLDRWSVSLVDSIGLSELLIEVNQFGKLKFTEWAMEREIELVQNMVNEIWCKNEE